MLQALDIIEKYISFFESKNHKRIPNSPLVPQNDPTTLFTSSGMQPLVPFLLGEKHPQGKRLVNVQNSFRAQDIDEIGDNRHTTFFRMLGNWSLGDYFKKEQIPWYWEFLTREIGLPKEKLYVTVFKGDESIPRDSESEKIWTEILTSEGLDPKEKIFSYGADKNWWSRAGTPDKMPKGEPGGPDSEVFFDFGTPHDKKFGENCHPNCECGRFLEIGNSVFMEYLRTESGFEKLPNQNVDFGGGLERLLAAYENQADIFQTSLLYPIVKTLEKITGKNYKEHKREMRIVIDHFIAATFITAADVMPSKNDKGYILRRLIRRGFDNLRLLSGVEIKGLLEKIVEQYSITDTELTAKYEHVQGVIIEEEQAYDKTKKTATEFITKKYHGKLVGDELKGEAEISADDAFVLYSTHGLSPTQIKSLGYIFDEQEFAKRMEEHANISRQGATKKFQGGLADHSEATVMGHTATHLLHQALRDVLGNTVKQSGSNITNERIRFDFSFDRKLTDEEVAKVEKIINRKIEKNLPVHFEIMPLKKAKEIGAIGLFDDKYENDVKVYFVGPSAHSTSSGQAGSGQDAYSKEFCGGPHVDFTGELKRFKIIKQESISQGQRRIYSKVHDL
ncbi:MAG: alanine--tRNA ligase [Patescibacteria group bacterium]